MSTGLQAALAQDDPAARLQAAMSAGSSPEPRYVEALIARCRIEPDFYVRDMLTWALVRHPAAQVLPLLHEEVSSPIPQGRSQALHTLSKIGDLDTRHWITQEHLHDSDDEIARAAWRAAVGLTRDAVLADVADELELATLRELTSHPEVHIRAHAVATLQLYADPESSFTIS